MLILLVYIMYIFEYVYGFINNIQIHICIALHTYKLKLIDIIWINLCMLNSLANLLSPNF